MAAMLQLWNKWEVQILVLFSLALQVFLLSFAGLRRGNNPAVIRIVLWLAYLLADSIAVYIRGHMSIACKLGEHQQFMAFWASFLLVHLGGQDTITAYAMEDNNLWLRHLLTLGVQAVGAAYLQYKYIAGSETMFMSAAILMFAIGVVKYGERVWSLKAANLYSVSKLLDSVKMENHKGTYPARSTQVLDNEVVLQGAHDLLYICMGQFVDYQIWPSELQSDAIKLFYDEKKMYELTEMQLSLMYDIFYTKAAMVHTWHGLCIRAFSYTGTVIACLLFHFSAAKNGYNRVDVAVTYVLLIGAFLLEVASVLQILMSTWTCATFKARRWDRLHHLVVSLRRHVKAAQINRSWTGSSGHSNLLMSGSKASLTSRMLSVFRKDVNSISVATKDLVLTELIKMVERSEGNEIAMRSYRGHQFALRRRADGAMEKVTWTEDIEFDESILVWHFATDILLFFFVRERGENELVEATRAVSNYMMFLLVKHPYMLPSPVRSRLYLSARQKLDILLLRDKEWMFEQIRRFGIPGYKDFPKILFPGVKLAHQLLSNKWSDGTVLGVVSRVWVEKLSYAAHHCNRDSHAGRLNNGGGEFISVVWLLVTWLFHGRYSANDWYRRRAVEFFETRTSTQYDVAKIYPMIYPEVIREI